MALKKSSRVFCFLLLSLSVVIGFLMYGIFHYTLKKMEYRQRPREYANAFDAAIAFSYTSNAFTGEKLVHLDLKGAPPKPEYLTSFFDLIATLGATGIVVEYEDMFPYLGNVSAANAYDPGTVSYLVTEAEARGLAVIPLVQTFGHLEFLLKLDRYRSWRESDEYPTVLCPSRDDAVVTLYDMIDQVLALHPNARYFHMGCDEVSGLGNCHTCRDRMIGRGWTKHDLYFAHVRRIAEYITNKYPKVQPIIWADEILPENDKFIQAYEIPKYVQVMWWNYKVRRDYYPTPAQMSYYVETFGSLWIASAFKGAGKLNQIVPNPEQHLVNHQLWMQLVDAWKGKIQFNGILITGWQRFNHFAVLCELLPVGIPTLATNLQFLQNLKGDFQSEASHILGCNLHPPETLDAATIPNAVTEVLNCTFPGFNVYKLTLVHVQTLKRIELYLNFLTGPEYMMFNMVNNFSLPSDARKRLVSLINYRTELRILETNLRTSLRAVYDETTVQEWLMTHLMPYQFRLEAIVRLLESMRDTKTWTRRPVLADNAEPEMRSYFSKICGPHDTRGCSLFAVKPFVSP